MIKEYDIRMATQGEVLLKETEEMIRTIREAQGYLSDMNPSLAFRLWQKVELDLVVFHKMATELKEEYGTPKKESQGQV
jgi:hypothetical protein